MNLRFVSRNRLASLMIVSGALAFSALPASPLPALAPQNSVGELAPVTVIAGKSTLDTTSSTRKSTTSTAGRKIA